MRQLAKRPEPPPTAFELGMHRVGMMIVRLTLLLVLFVLLVNVLLQRPLLEAFLFAVALAVGLGAGLSNVVAGYIVQGFGYPAGFLSLAAVAVAALVFFWTLMPETRDAKENQPVAA